MAEPSQRRLLPLRKGRCDPGPPRLEFAPLQTRGRTVLCVRCLWFRLPKDETCFFLFLGRNQDAWPFLRARQRGSVCLHHFAPCTSPPSSHG